MADLVIVRRFRAFKNVNHQFGTGRCLDRVRSAFRQLACGIERSGPAGEPFPEDIEQRDRASEILEKLSPGSEGYRLFKDIRDDAEKRIRESLEENEED